MKFKSKIFILEILILVVICSLNQGLILGLLWVFLHEITHILVSRLYGIKVDGVRLNLTGAKADIYGIDELMDRDKIILYISGPLFNLFCFLVFFFIKDYYDIGWINICMKVNLGLFIFNLIPAYPLDGARIYEVILSKYILFKRTKKILVNISYLVSGILILLFFLMVYIHKDNISLLFAAILITYSTFLEKRNTMYIIMDNLFKKSRRLRRMDYIENKNISVYYKSSLVKAMSLLDKNRFNCFLILNEGLKLLGIVYEDELIEALKEYGNISFNDYLNIRNKSGQ